MLADTMIMDYVRNRTLGLVYALSNYNAGPEAYAELLRIAQQAADDLDAGRDPGDRIVNLNGEPVEL